jgi:hypothetical protein
MAVSSCQTVSLVNVLHKFKKFIGIKYVFGV